MVLGSYARTHPLPYPVLAVPFTIASRSYMFRAKLLHSIQADDPTNSEMGAGAGSNFQGDRDAARNFRDTSGVVEGRPGIIESSNIDPLNERSNDGTSCFFISFAFLFVQSCGWLTRSWLSVHRRWLGKRSQRRHPLEPLKLAGHLQRQEPIPWRCGQGCRRDARCYWSSPPGRQGGGHGLSQRYWWQIWFLASQLQ
jgi:hypothetical protein